ncbi:hypothetical protein B0H11DRAFT_2234602 [Mycena galericulata]|nr:hypothetical protein B0H11DRAFT_2234602 [Mycena galericulata]
MSPPSTSKSYPPPLTSRHRTGLTDYEIQMKRKEERREKARLRMARIRAELKTRPLHEQELAAARARAYQATYRAKHRENLRLWEAERRIAVYKAKFGHEAYLAYVKARRDRKRRAYYKRMAKAGLSEEDAKAARRSRKTDGVDGGRAQK